MERIKAVDRAAAMVEELLKQGSISNGGKVNVPIRALLCSETGLTGHLILIETGYYSTEHVCVFGL